MGILGTILTRIGLPLALAVATGLILFRFKDPLISAISGGASTLGQAITSPFGALLQGINTGFSNIPATIDFTFPSFNFGFAPGADPGGDQPNEIAITEEGFDFDQALVNLCRNSGGILCFGESGGGNGGNGGSQQASLTPFADSFITTSSTGFGEGQQTMRESFAELIARNKDVVGLFDFKGTPETEFFALTQAEIEFFGGKDQLIFSGQVFKEIKNIDQAIGFDFG